ncbi:3-deoxy-D-manno-octulosonate 8-phosphate phosphatase [Desulfoluna limicola]|uniref:3-deoxy-D-manno-octulosonate 8-phosphate phosphatase n=1 Tax=Desulfoluna limicola TaxID=2810562 RepID=A0ABM7PC48_9BACT|nr:HAD hydrolase family protein [Desulfoluna limicola]BCS94642.1 3-deoxy-D-manno-octulosonate 8-phosphate phosphatase [Desulfoluna limicola]
MTPNEKLASVDLLIMDVDGVLTQGEVIYHDDGSQIKIFNVRDGLGLRLLMDAGIQTAIVTGRSAGALEARVKNLGIPFLLHGVSDKAAALLKVVEQSGVPAHRMAFIGDDLPDLPIMSRVGTSIAVADAAPEVKDRATITTTHAGGKGAVRETCEAILKAKGLWETSIERFLS